jgi:hypothetical protein
LISAPLLFKRDHDPFATGSARYVESRLELTGVEARILLHLSVEPIPRPVLAVVDTAAPWCIFEPEVGNILRQRFSPVQGGVVLNTRLGILKGSLYRIPVALPADEGQSLEAEATVFLSPDWRGPNFIGYQGLLQRIRFAVDPEENLFYFGRI